MRKLCNFFTFISPHASTLFHHALTFCHLMYCILFCVFIYCICILPTDMHCIEYNEICWQLQLVEKLSTHIFVLAIEIKSVFLCLPFPSWCIFVCILIWMRLKSCVINIGFTFIKRFAYNAVSEPRTRKSSMNFSSAIIRTIGERKGCSTHILIVMHKRLTIYCTITHLKYAFVLAFLHLLAQMSLHPKPERGRLWIDFLL